MLSEIHSPGCGNEPHRAGCIQCSCWPSAMCAALSHSAWYWAQQREEEDPRLHDRLMQRQLTSLSRVSYWAPNAEQQDPILHLRVYWLIRPLSLVWGIQPKTQNIKIPGFMQARLSDLFSSGVMLRHTLRARRAQIACPASAQWASLSEPLCYWAQHIKQEGPSCHAPPELSENLCGQKPV